jgi:hypothetical protein
MNFQQLCSHVLVVAVAAFLALTLFVSGCHGVNW